MYSNPGYHRASITLSRLSSPERLRILRRSSLSLLFPYCVLCHSRCWYCLSRPAANEMQNTANYCQFLRARPFIEGVLLSSKTRTLIPVGKLTANPMRMIFLKKMACLTDVDRVQIGQCA